MARVRSRPVRTETSRAAVQHDAVQDETLPEAASDDNSPVAAIGAKPRDPHRRAVHPDEPEVELPLDMAIEALLAAEGVDPVSQIRLDEMRRELAEADARHLLSLLYGESIQTHLMRFLMPRLRHPEVLRSGSSHAILDYLLHTISHDASSGTDEGYHVIAAELQRMELLQQNRNTMIEG